jgi:chaperonin GroES
MSESPKQPKLMKPLFNRVMIHPIEQSLVLPSGLILPENAAQPPTEGIVVTVGYTRDAKGRKIALDIEPGDQVLYAKYGGVMIELDNIKYIIVRYDDILAVLTED